MVSASLAPTPSATPVTLRTKSWNCSFLATKSVWLLTSTAVPLVPSTATPTRPSAAVRLDFFAAVARPLARSRSTAASISPFVSSSAFLASIMPAPERSRRSLTAAAVIADIIVSFRLWFGRTSQVQKHVIPEIIGNPWPKASVKTGMSGRGFPL